MRDYLLFVDTETSGLPKDWRKPYAAEGNWPHMVQVAWVVYTKEGSEVKKENHYIRNDDYEVSIASKRIHGISHEFLQEHGKDRKTVMEQLRQDLLQYQPMVISHFTQLDLHMLGLGFYRTNLENPLLQLPSFCTMKVTEQYVTYAQRRFLRLGELHHKLFNKKLHHQHDALVDASATAKCFFEMWRRGEITEEVVAKQQQLPLELEEVPASGGKWLRNICFLLLVAMIFAIVYFFLMGLYE